MAVSLIQNKHKEIHYFGEPWSLVELERMPHLHSLAMSVRETLHANKTFRDIKLQNEMVYKNFIELCEKDVIFFLKITQQYYLLSKLFDEGNLKGKLAHFFDKLREQYHQQQQNQYTPPIVATRSLIEKPKTPDFYTPSSDFSWSEPDPNWSNLQKWQYYESELKRLTINYHQQKIQTYADVIDNDITRAEDVLKQLDKESPKYHEIDSLISRCVKRKKELLARQYDGVEILEQEQEIKLLEADLHRMFLNIYKSSNNEVLKKAYESQKERQSHLDAKIGKIDVEYEQVRAKLSERIKECRAEATKEVDGALQEIIQAIDNTNSSELSESQKEILVQLGDNINTYREQLASANSSEQYQDALGAVTAILKDQFSVLPEVLKNKIIPVADQLEQMHVVQGSLLEKKVQVNEQLGVDNSAFIDKIGAPDTHIVNPGSMSVNEIKQQVNSFFIDKQRSMKAEVNHIKQQYLNREEVNTENGEHNNIKEVCLYILDDLSMIENDQLTPEEQEVLNEIKSNIGMLQESDYQVGTEEACSIIADINYHLDELGDKIRSLNKLQLKINSILETMETQLEEQESIKVSMR